MAIEQEDLRTIFRALSLARSFRRKKLLILGNASVYANPERLSQIAQEENFAIAPVETSLALSPKILGKALGFHEVETLDLAPGSDRQMDLSAALPEAMLGQYDCIIDAGVLFWCFDPAATIKNIYRLLADQGIVVHITALTGHISRGYFNIHPRYFEDFYGANAADFLLASYRSNFGRSGWAYWLKKLLGWRNQSRCYTQKGFIFPKRVCFHYAEFATEPVVDLPFLPIDMVSVTCFQKRDQEPVRTPALTSI